MKLVRLEFHHEDDGWWAESPDLPGFSAAGVSLDEVRQMAYEGIQYFVDDEVLIEEPDLVNGIVTPWRVSGTELCSFSTNAAHALQAFSAIRQVPAGISRGAMLNSATDAAQQPV